MAKRHQPTWEPSQQDFYGVLVEQNPWHVEKSVPAAWAHHKERPLALGLATRLQDDSLKRFQLILGPRRVGKTVAMYQTVRRLLPNETLRMWWMRLDHPVLMLRRLDELVKFAMQNGKASRESPIYLFLDELNYAKDWDLWLKTFYDEQWPVRIVATSSATAALQNRKLESGVGRWEEQFLTPYLLGEYLDLLGQGIELTVGETLAATLTTCIEHPLDLTGVAERRRRYMLTGGFPELLMSAEARHQDEQTALLTSQQTLRSDAVERAIYKDIPQAYGVNDPLLLERLLYILGGQMTGILAPKNICQSLDGMSQPTFDRYLSYLEKTFMVFTLPNFSANEETVQRRGRKLYFVDGAVRNAALQRGLALLSNDKEFGLLHENLAAGHLHALGRQTQTRLYHWREKQDEVDLIYDHPSSPLAFEIGGPNHHVHGLQRFISKYPRFKASCYLVTPNDALRRPNPTTGEVGLLPFDLFLLAVSKQAEAELIKRLLPGIH